jgi:hypothetical protein
VRLARTPKHKRLYETQTDFRDLFAVERQSGPTGRCLIFLKLE